jgi:hypothetical protein
MSGIAGVGAIAKDLSEIATGIQDLQSGNKAEGRKDIAKGLEGLEHNNDKHHHCQGKGDNDFQQVLSELGLGQSQGNNNQIAQLLESF